MRKSERRILVSLLVHGPRMVNALADQESIAQLKEAGHIQIESYEEPRAIYRITEAGLDALHQGTGL